MDLTSEEKMELAISRLKNLLRSKYSISSSYSGGKDSTVCVILMLEAMRQLKQEGEYVPNCYIMNSNTRRDMPMMNIYLEESLSNIRVFCAKHDLPVEVVQVEPSIAGRWTWTCLGRGKLPRYPGQSVDCSVDEKITPMQRQTKLIEDENIHEIITLVGTRASESSKRERSMRKYQMSETAIVEIDGKRTYSLISDWELDDVWSLIVSCSGSKEHPPRCFATFNENFDQLATLYRDANDGHCTLVFDKKHSSGCGSRFGCSWCLSNGDRDKSLESLIREDVDKYGFMSPLIEFRTFLQNIRFDLSRRDFRGRNVSQAGYLKVTPDYFNSRTKRELLRYLITIDVMEKERAEEHQRKWDANEIEHTDHNSLLCEPMFQYITYDDVLIIDFAWSLQRDFGEASAAAKDYIEIHDLGYRYPVPSIKEAPRVSIPKRRWFDVSKALPHDEDVDGLFYLIPETQTLYLGEISLSDALSVEPGSGWSYLRAVRNAFYELHLVDHQEVCRAALKNRWISMRKADVKRYDDIARRHDYIYKLMQSETPMKEDIVTGDDLIMSVDEYLRDNSISDEEHSVLLSRHYRKELEAEYEQDLFGVDSVVDAMELGKPAPAPKARNSTLHRVDDFKDIANQITIDV
ncbi:hypothetical protein VTH8203_00827 [Vibrio thalassae]|uniref:Phosphoadenosine phosphosulphate reductase domain-containing protein n=1 Tax=Vibrio thalassae TaxID=1243014 RepID=A0A240EFA5_9VIBR|nr:phosphoadenosine phosphosulfate reductase family protein [Vibrio thalassae]SNX47226.1 hypothetical protein VTH8203_00827 [Vibrio thalassae]